MSGDTKGTPEEVRAHAAIMLELLDGPVGHDALSRGAASEDALARMRREIVAWGEAPDAFFANIHVEVVGHRP